MTTSAADLIQSTQRYLHAGTRESLNTLAGAHDASQTTFTFTRDLDQIKEGAYLSVDLEILYVWAIGTGSSLTATVQRGMLGSTAAAHIDLSLVRINPKFPDFSIFQELNNDLADLSSPSNGIYRIVDVDLTYNAAIQGYDITGATDILDILRVRYQIPGPSNIWPETRKFALKRDAETSSFASGFGLVLYQPAYPGRTVRVTYSAPLTPFTALTSTVASTGLPTSAYDLPPLGAAMRLSGVRETARDFFESQGDTRRATEVPPGSQTLGMRALAQMRQERIKNESNKLSSSYPARRQVV